MFSKYHTELDDCDRNMIDKRVAEKGIEEYLNQQLVYLDCSRIIKGMRMMQTIGYPYKREISSYLYVLESVAGNDFDFDKEWLDKLIKRHKANLEYEKENPPIWYDEKPKKSTRKRKVKEVDMFPETKLPKLTKEDKKKAKIQDKVKSLGFGTFKLVNPNKKDG